MNKTETDELLLEFTNLFSLALQFACRKIVGYGFRNALPVLYAALHISRLGTTP